MPFCPQCGHKHDAGAKFCSSCGYKLATTVSPPRKNFKPTPPSDPVPSWKKNPAPPSDPVPSWKTNLKKHTVNGPTNVNKTGDGKSMHQFRGVGTAHVNRPTKIEPASWTPKAKVDSKRVGVAELTQHEQWAYYTSKLSCTSRGYGIHDLKSSLPKGKCGFVVFRISAENVGNTGKGIITNANIILQWKGPSASTMNKVKNNGALQSALTKLKPNKGFIEVLGIKNLSTANIYDRWRPGSGSKVIQD